MDIKEIEKTAEKVMKAQGEHRAQIMFMQPNSDKMAIMLVPMGDDKEKEISRFLLKNVIFSQNIQKYWFISEIWCSQDINSERPSKDPKKKEALMIQEYSKDGKNYSIIKFFDRIRNTIKWGERMI